MTLEVEAKSEHVSICFTRSSWIPYKTLEGVADQVGQTATVWQFTCIRASLHIHTEHIVKFKNRIYDPKLAFVHHH